MTSEQIKNLTLNNPQIKALSSRKDWIVIRNGQPCRVKNIEQLAYPDKPETWGSYNEAKRAAFYAPELIDAIGCYTEDGELAVFDGSTPGYSAKPSTTAAALASRLNAEPQGDEYIAFCPVHEATGHHTPSLSFRDGDTQIVFWCRSRNCDTKAIARLLLDREGSKRKLSNEDRHSIKVSQIKFNALVLRDPDKVYEYTDNAGGIGNVGGVVAYKGKWIDPVTGEKFFNWWHFDAKGRKRYGKPKDMLPFYNLHNALRAETVWVVEGEKDVDTLAGLGHVATTASDGAGSWHGPSAWPMLMDKMVIMCPDNDDAGEQYLADVLDSLGGKSVRVVRVPAPHKDISDYIEAGGTIKNLLSPPNNPPEEAQQHASDTTDTENTEGTGTSDAAKGQGPDSDSSDSLPNNRDDDYRRPDIFAVKALPGKGHEGFLPVGEISLAGGSSGSGKTYAELMLLEAIRNGRKFCGHETTPMDYRILLHDRSKQSMARTVRETGHPLDEVMSRVIRLSPKEQASTPAHVLKQYAQKFPNVRLWAIEGLDMWAEKGNEMKIVSAELDALERAAKRHGIVVYATMGSPKMRGKDQYEGRDKLFGSSAYGRKAETIFLFDSFPEKENQRFKKCRVLVRNGRPEDFVFEFHPEHGFCQGSDPTEHAVEKGSDSAIDKMAERIRAAFKSGERVVFRQGLDPETTFDRARKKMVADGEIVLTKREYIMQEQSIF